jgi:deoxyadenosine/deoxycytidine kinase
MVIYSIEGNIGSGKSTFVSALKERYGERFVFLQEPIEEWKTIVDPETGKNKIELFYEDMKIHSFSFQIMAFITRITAIKEALTQTPGKHIVIERSIYTDKNVFAKMLHEDKMISPTDYQIYMKCFEYMTSNLPEIRYIYIQSSPEIALARIRERNRPGEENITAEYIQRLHKKHDEWLIPISQQSPDKILTINGNINIQETEQYTKALKDTYEFCCTPIDRLADTMRGYFA